MVLTSTQLIEVTGGPEVGFTVAMVNRVHTATGRYLPPNCEMHEILRANAHWSGTSCLVVVTVYANNILFCYLT